MSERHGTSSSVLTCKPKAGLRPLITPRNLAPGFDVDIHNKIFTKLQNLCAKGKAATYVDRAAAVNGYGAGQELIKRYAGFAKQRLRSLRRFIETKLRHVHGTSIVDHIDLFEKVCGYMGECGESPNDEKNIDRFLDTVSENIYEAVNTHCVLLHLEGTLTFPQMVKLYTNKCFSRYPQFHIKALGGGTNKKDTLSNNSIHMSKGKGHNQ